MASTSTHKFILLQAAVTAITGPKPWSEAVNEFAFVTEMDALSGAPFICPGGIAYPMRDDCPCSTPIRWNEVLRHDSGRHIIVGSVCVDRFMRDNARLVADVARAGRMRDYHPCEDCARPTPHERWCKRCERAVNRAIAERAAHEAAIAAEAERERAREEHWGVIAASIKIDAMTPYERDFVTKSVRACIVAGRDLSPKQAAWFERLRRRYRA